MGGAGGKKVIKGRIFWLIKVFYDEMSPKMDFGKNLPIFLWPGKAKYFW